MAAPVIDQVARDGATEAKSLLSAHERVCAERQGNIIARLAKMEKMMGGGFKWLVAVMGSIILALLGMLAKGATLSFH